MSQDNAPELPPYIVALTTLAAGVAAGHPTQPRCQLDRLRGMGIPEPQIHTVVELARHVGDEAARQGDEDLDEALVGSALTPGASAGCCARKARPTPFKRPRRVAAAAASPNRPRPAAAAVSPKAERARRATMSKEIKVLGTGCRNCQATADLIEQVAADQGADIALEKVEDMGAIMSYGVMSTPGVVVDGTVVNAGGVPDRKKVAEWLAG